MFIIKFFFVITILFSMSSFSVLAETMLQDHKTHKGTRLFSIAITMPTIKDINEFWKVYEDALDLAIETGIDVPGELMFTWSNIEKKSFLNKISYHDDSSINIVEMHKRKHIPAVITIAPFETMNTRIPKDLRKLPYDHPDVMMRFKAFIDWIYKITEGLEVEAIVFGNEFDIHLAFEAAKGNNNWKALEGMVVQTKEYIKSLDRWKSVPFALEPTFDGLMGASWKELQRINQHTDIIGVSYYPLNGNAVHEPSILHEHLTDLFKVYPNKKIDFYQYGYPSSEKINGSLEKQRQFIESSFKYWDQYADKIRLITFTWLYDVKQTHIESMTSDTLQDITPTEAFVEFLGSLGLHGSEIGEEKPAFKELKKQLKNRGWLH